MKKLLILIFLALFGTIYAQEIKQIGSLPFIKYFSQKEYKAAPRNWSATQDSQGNIYIANDNGSVLVYDGSNWTTIKISTNSPIRSVNFINNKIFIGGYNTFGFLKPSSNGELSYYSLSNELPAENKEFQDVWDIFQTKDSSLFFQSFEKIFIYKNKKFKTIKIDDIFPQGLFLISFQINKDIYTYVKYKGIYKLIGDSLFYLPSTQKIGNSFVRAILPYKNNKMLIVTWYDGIFLFDDKTLTQISTPIDDIIKTNIYRASEIDKNYYIFQIYNGGLLISDRNFNIIQYLKAPQDIANDRVFKVFVDNQKDLWLCSDKGISVLYPYSPFTIFDNRQGFEIGTTVQSSILLKNYLLVATNSGLYYTKWRNNTNNQQTKNLFKVLDNPYGNFSTRKLKIFKNNLFVCTDGGLFSLNLDNIEKDTNFVENLKYKSVLNNRAINELINDNKDTNTLFGLSTALFIFRHNNKEWYLYKDYQNFKGHYIIQDNKDNIWISDLYSGLLLLKIDTTFNIKVLDSINSQNFSKYGLQTSNNIGIFKIDTLILFTSPNGVYTFNYSKKVFEPYSPINQALGSQNFLNFIIKDNNENIWFKKQVEQNNTTNWYLGSIEKKEMKTSQTSNFFNYLKNNIYSLSIIDSSTYIIGTDFGFIHYDSQIDFQNIEFSTQIRSVEILSQHDSVLFGGVFFDKDTNISSIQLNNQIPIIPFKYNNLRFKFSANYYSNTQALEYSYYLEGHDKNWSNWTTETYKDYSNIPKGTYTFKVKSKNTYNQESSIALYTFTIKPPFYLTIWAFLVYVFIAGLIVFAILRIYTYRLRKQKEYLEEQVRLRTKEIEQQKEEIRTQRDLLANKNEEIEKINKDITSSIEYAKRIQTAMLPLEITISEHLENYFILFKPRDIVSGDYYWFTTKEDKIFIAAVDCTGHGVPGAFMSMIGAQILTTIVNVKHITEADQILSELNENIRNALKQDTTDTQDGMDMALCIIDKNKKILEFAGAKNPLYYISNENLEMFKGSKQAIGGFQYETFKKHTLEYQSPSYFYIFTDGYADQFGGPEQSKFMIGRFKKLLIDNHKKTFKEQKEILNSTITQWQGENFQTDDILVIGFKL